VNANEETNTNPPKAAFKVGLRDKRKPGPDVLERPRRVEES